MIALLTYELSPTLVCATVGYLGPIARVVDLFAVDTFNSFKTVTYTFSGSIIGLHPTYLLVFIGGVLDKSCMVNCRKSDNNNKKIKNNVRSACLETLSRSKNVIILCTARVTVCGPPLAPSLLHGRGP